MKINYYADTDSLYIDLSSKPSVDSLEVSEGVVLDYDVEGNLVGIDIDATNNLTMTTNLGLTIPGAIYTISGNNPDSLHFHWQTLGAHQNRAWL